MACREDQGQIVEVPKVAKAHLVIGAWMDVLESKADQVNKLHNVLLHH